ncbi:MULTISPECIES: RHS repeat-associated core domain-containing protein [unclassified Dysgonomonas]|uniref:RHS repeat-associated core domain-containing protein n=1 Tax=unclassified Dysgonomonas TaxID=2630389 RepID=UPI002474AA9D|nr:MULTISPECIES: RHS repeat-associated core domain-containing protein [unclassified Dysgonomonas]
MKYCNGAETNYSYDQERRRLDNLSVTAPSGSPAGGGLILDNRYTYDKVDNVLSVVNSATPPSGGRGASYTLEMAYDNLHNITSKKQHVEQKGIQFDGVLKAGYELAYNYNSEKPHQIANILDDNYRTEGTDDKELTKKEHKYEYDANGNLVYINTERPKKDGTQTPKSTERKLLWDEENRLEAIDDNGFVSNYWYDAAGERTVKTSGEGEEIYVNSLFSGGNTQTADFTAYVNPYIVVSKGGQYTKHIYIGSQRIVSKLGDLDSYGPDPRRVEYAGSNVDGAKVDYKAKYQALQQTIKDRYNKFEVPYHGKDNDDYVNGSGFCCDDTPQTKSFAAGANDNPELFQYYYHSDHLGSSSLITNLDGEVVQHIEYVPFGEVFIEERNNTWNTPYLFNAKELDEETGLYYYGARYYDPRTSIWLSVDALATYNPFEQENFIEGQHNGGIYNSFNHGVYTYCYQNPVKLIDPNGKQTKPIQTFTVHEYVNYWKQNYNGGRDIKTGQYQTLYAGCIGVTALNLGMSGTLTITPRHAPPTYPAFESLNLAQNEAKKMMQTIKDNPDIYNNGEHVVIFAMRFWVPYKNRKDFKTDENGRVDMSTYSYKWRNEGRTNFDFGFYDGQYWWHGNHDHDPPEKYMKVYKSTLEHFERDLYDFSHTVFIPAISTQKIEKAKIKQK